MILLKTPRAASELFLVKWASVLSDTLAVLMPQPSDALTCALSDTSSTCSTVVGVDRQARLCSSIAFSSPSCDQVWGRALPPHEAPPPPRPAPRRLSLHELLTPSKHVTVRDTFLFYGTLAHSCPVDLLLHESQNMKLVLWFLKCSQHL